MLARYISKFKYYTGLDKVETFMRIIKENGGVSGSIKTLYLTDDLKTGTLVGTDEFGNKYYENPFYFFPRNRWVIYNHDKVWLEYNASQIPPRWHRWLHHIGEEPAEDKKYEWIQPYKENMTGTNEAYTPFSTVQPKIHAWKPSKRLQSN